MRRVLIAFVAAAIALGGAFVVRSAQPAGAAPDAAGTFASLPPARILDTRVGTGLNGAFAPNQIRDLAVTGVGGVPASGVDAVAVNVTVTAPSAAGFLTLFPAGQALPLASNLNFVAGQTVPNVVVVKVGHGGSNEGKVSFDNSALPTGPSPGAGTVHVIADVVGWYSDGTTTGAGFTGVTPNRILDTRVNVGLPGAFAPNQTRSLTVTGAVVPADAAAVVLNVTVTQPTAAGFLTVYPAGDPSPLASSLNFVPGLTVPNLVIVKVGAGGQVSILNSAGSTHVIADVVGYYEAGTGSSLTSMPPQRLLDTRSAPAVPVQPNATVTIDPTVGTSLPPVAAYSGVVVNVTATAPTQAGFLTVYPSDTARPLASNLNVVANQTAPNLVMVKVGADGRFKIFNGSTGTVHVIVDIVGYYRDGGTPPPPPPPYTTAPQGTWTLASGSNGYVLGGFNNGTGDVTFIPVASFTLDQGSRNCWTCSTTDVRALMTPDGTDPHAASWFDPNQIRAHLSFSSPFTGTLHLYAVDWDTTARRETITVDDGRGPQTVDITTPFDQGAWTGFPVYVAAGGTVSITVSRTAGVNAVLSGIFLGEPGAPPLPPPPAQSIGQYCAPSTSSASAYQTAIDNLRKAGTGWATADGSIPVPLPDGRTLYLFGDTFVGSVNGSGTMSSSKYLVENSAVVQAGNCFNPLLRGSSSARTAWITPPASGQAYWPSSAVVDAFGNLQVFLMHVRYSDGYVYGMKIATFSLPSLTLQGISAQLPFTDLLRTYGTTALVDGGYAYLYSTHDQDQRLARVAQPSVTNAMAYEFWNGSTWVTEPNYNQAVALTFNNMHDSAGIQLHAPISGLWAVRYGNGFLGTAMLVNAYSQELGLFTASSPQGPWTYIANAATTPSNRFSYGALTTFRLQGMSPTPATIYSTNIQATPNTISEYGPRFVAPANVPPPLP